MSLRFAFLVLEEHPYGRQMLQTLLDADLVPCAVLQEVSEVGDEEREKFLTRMAGQPIAPRINQLLVGKRAPIFSVANHNDQDCLEILQTLEPDLLVLGGTRIIKKPILEIPAQGTLNAHPGLLPRLRGSASVGWALYKDLPIGATVHFIDPGIDTGDIIFRESLPIYRGDTYESINGRVAGLAAELMKRAVLSVTAGAFTRVPQDRNAGETLRVIPEELLEIGKQRLRDGTYSHFASQQRPG
jgi:methionyl-tRNA formyltransferase